MTNETGCTAQWTSLSRIGLGLGLGPGAVFMFVRRGHMCQGDQDVTGRRYVN